MLKLSEFKVLDTNREQPAEVIDYGVEMVGAPLEWGETQGQGIRIGIIDTGIDLDHPDLRGNIKDAVDFAGGGNGDDDNGHGTHVAGCVAAMQNGFGVVGVAPRAELYIAKAFNSRGNAEDKAISDSLKWMIDKKVDVINMSFSGSNGSTIYYELIKKAYKNGITFVSAAGNQGGIGNMNTIGYPAEYDECIAVTAVDMNKKRSDFSSEGPKAEVAAAGVNVYSTYLNGEYATLSGTSMATPLISGAVGILQGKAMIRLNRKLTPQEVRLLLNIYADDLGISGRDREYGFGIFSFGRICDCDINYEKISVIAEQLKGDIKPTISGASRDTAKSYAAGVTGILAIIALLNNTH